MSRLTQKALADPLKESSLADLRSDNPAVRELLDHMAEELAGEYVGLMKEAAAKPEERKD